MVEIQIMGLDGAAQETAGGDFVRIAVCDDEIRCVEDMKAILLGLQRLHGELSFEIDCLTSGTELITGYYPGKYDVIFLDMLMPEIDGMELARRIRRTDLDVSLVFATCMDARLPDGYEVMAADFIVKPVAAERVEKLILKLRRIERQRRQADARRQRQAGGREVRLKGGADAILRLEDTHYFVSTLHYMKAVTAGDELEFMSTMADAQKMVEGKDFVLAHRSYLVNMAYIWMFSEGAVTLATNATVPVGRKHAAAMREAYKKYKGGAAP
jgi:DNA-binding LytR/AlgR family response regulator